MVPRSAVVPLLGLRVRIPPGAGKPVCFEFCVLSGRGLCVGLITRPGQSYECVVSECDREASILNRFWPNRRGCIMEEKKSYSFFLCC